LYSLYDEELLTLVDVHEGYSAHIDEQELRIKAGMTEVLLRGGANPKVDLAHLILWYHSAKESPAVSTVIRDIFEGRGLLQEVASLFATLREVESDSHEGWASTLRKISHEGSRKRPWDHDSCETTDDYYGSRLRLLNLVDH
jgi:hypothetical protein